MPDDGIHRGAYRASAISVQTSQGGTTDLQTFLNNQGTSTSAVLTKSTSYTAAAGDTVLVDATTGAVTITLPAPVLSSRNIVVAKVDYTANAVIIAAPAGALVNDAATAVLPRTGDNITLITDGTNYRGI